MLEVRNTQSPTSPTTNEGKSEEELRDEVIRDLEEVLREIDRVTERYQQLVKEGRVQ